MVGLHYTALDCGPSLWCWSKCTNGSASRWLWMKQDVRFHLWGFLSNSKRAQEEELFYVAMQKGHEQKMRFWIKNGRPLWGKHLRQDVTYIFCGGGGGTWNGLLPLNMINSNLKEIYPLQVIYANYKVHMERNVPHVIHEGDRRGWLIPGVVWLFPVMWKNGAGLKTYWKGGRGMKNAK